MRLRNPLARFRLALVGAAIGVLVAVLLAPGPAAPQEIKPPPWSVLLSPGPYVAAQNGTGWSNTGHINSEINLQSIPYPALGPNDALRISSSWNTTGTSTDTKVVIIRLATAGGSCTPGSACSTGSTVQNITLNSAALISADMIKTVRNANVTSTQSVNNVNNPYSGVSGGAATTVSVETNAGGFINFDCNTVTSGSDSCALLGYTIEILRGQ